MKYYQIVVCDTEESFAVALTNYMNRSGQIPGLVMAFTEPEELRRYLREHTPDVILAGNGMEAICREAVDSPVLWVGEDGRQAEADRIDRYSPATVYVRRTLELLSEGAPSTGGAGCCCAAVYAPVGRCGKTTVAHALCREAVQAEADARCIYLGWEEFGEKAEEPRAMEELLYDIKLKKGTLSMKMKALSDAAPGYDCIRSAASYQELRELSREDVGWLLEQVRQEGYYRLLVADIGSASLTSLESLLEFDFVYLPYLQETAVQNKLCAYAETMRQMGLWEHFQEICYPLPMDPAVEGADWKRIEERRRNGELLCLGDRKEELWAWTQSGYAER